MSEYCAGCGKPMTAWEIVNYGDACEECGAEPLCAACRLCGTCAEDEQGAYDDDMEAADAEFA